MPLLVLQSSMSTEGIRKYLWERENKHYPESYFVSAFSIKKNGLEMKPTTGNWINERRIAS